MNYWKDVRARQVIPAGYLAIPEVFDIIGRHHFGPSGQWTGGERTFEDLGPAFARPKDVFDGDSNRLKNAALYNRHAPQVLKLLGRPSALHHVITNAQWTNATDLWREWEVESLAIVERRQAILWIMYRLGMVGKISLGIGYCYTDSQGVICEVAAQHWNCDFQVACDRFERAALCGKSEYAMHRPNPWQGGRDYFEHFVIPIYVAEINLNAVLPNIPVFDEKAALAASEDPSLHVVEGFLARRATISAAGSQTVRPQQKNAYQREGVPAEPSKRWGEGEMTEAIQIWVQQNSSRDRDRAWRSHFKASISEHGWDNRSFRDHWSVALGSAGQPGRPKSAQ